MEGTEQYRAALDEWAAETGHTDDRLQCRCLTLEPEMRADADKRTVEGIVVRYGAIARLRGIRERVRVGALSFPNALAQNLTLQHNRERPIGRLEFEDSPDALRFRATLAPGPRADQALMDISSGLLRGASMEFWPKQVQPIMDGAAVIHEIAKGQVSRVSLVDVSAYPSSRFAVRAEDVEDEPEQEIRILPGPLTDTALRARLTHHWLC